MKGNSFKTLLAAAAVGFIFALWLTVRWRMMGSKAKWAAVPDGEPFGESAQTADVGDAEGSSMVARSRQVASHFGESVATGAKADAKRIRATCRRVTHRSPTQNADATATG